MTARKRTASPKPRRYGDAVAAAQDLVRAARLADPDEHYPYKAAEVRRLLDDNPNMGPGDPSTGLDGSDDNRAQPVDFTSPEIVDASERVVQAQRAYLEDPGDATKAEYDAAKVALRDARQAHRVNRGPGGVVAVRTRRAGE